MLGFERIIKAHTLQIFRRKAWDTGDIERLAFGQRIADAQVAMVLEYR